MDSSTDNRNAFYFRLFIMLSALFLAGCASSPATPTPAPTPSLSSRIITAPIDSTGCGKSPLVPLAQTVSQEVLSAGVNREYLLHLPSDYQDDAGTALVLNFHGHSSNAQEQEERSGMSTIADQRGFIVVYPQGLRGKDGEPGWATSPTRADQVDDVLFVSDLLNQLQARLCIDPHRIFATGFSNGGGMTNLLACEMAGRLAAFAPVSGSYHPDPYPGGCQPARPVPILEIHGTEDEVVPYDGKPAEQIPPVSAWLKDWADRDGCKSGPNIFYQHARLTGMEWTGCKDEATVMHYRVSGEGHAWPPDIFAEPGSNGERTISGSLLIWLFFQQHPLPGTIAANERMEIRG